MATDCDLRLRFPSADYEDEYGACRQYLPEETTVARDALARLEAGGPLTISPSWCAAGSSSTCRAATTRRRVSSAERGHDRRLGGTASCRYVIT